MVSVRALLLSWAQVRAFGADLRGEEHLEGSVVLDAESVVFVDVDLGEEGLVAEPSVRVVAPCVHFSAVGEQVEGVVKVGPRVGVVAVMGVDAAVGGVEFGKEQIGVATNIAHFGIHPRVASQENPDRARDANTIATSRRALRTSNGSHTTAAAVIASPARKVVMIAPTPGAAMLVAARSPARMVILSPMDSVVSPAAWTIPTHNWSATSNSSLVSVITTNDPNKLLAGPRAARVSAVGSRLTKSRGAEPGGIRAGGDRGLGPGLPAFASGQVGDPVALRPRASFLCGRCPLYDQYVLDAPVGRLGAHMPPLGSPFRPWGPDP